MFETEIIKTKIGLLEIKTKNGYVYSCRFIDDEIVTDTTNRNKELIMDIKNYFRGRTTKLVSKIKLVGKGFQKKVWKEILKIPYGETRTYGEIATAINQPNAYRAVANACGQNRLALFVPCHRVISKNGSGGYKWGVEIKEWLLELENQL